MGMRSGPLHFSRTNSTQYRVNAYWAQKTVINNNFLANGAIKRTKRKMYSPTSTRYTSHPKTAAKTICTGYPQWSQDHNNNHRPIFTQIHKLNKRMNRKLKESSMLWMKNVILNNWRDKCYLNRGIAPLKEKAWWVVSMKVRSMRVSQETSTVLCTIKYIKQVRYPLNRIS